MRKLILISILVANAVIPIRMARERNAGRGLRKTLCAMLAFDVFYLLAIVLLYPRV
jgi:hypothetical protein